MGELLIPGGKPMNSDLDGGQPSLKLSREKALERSSRGVAESGAGRYLCWWMAVQLGRGQWEPFLSRTTVE